MTTDLVNDESAPGSNGQARRPWILLVAGINLVLAQYWAIREYLVVMSRSELTILLVTGSFFASCSLGYLVAPRRFSRLLKGLCLVLFAAQLLFPWLLKEVAAFMYREQVPHITPVLLGMGILVMAPLYTILLPYLIDAGEGAGRMRGGEALMICYGLELIGALLGVGAILVMGLVGLTPLVVLYVVNAALILSFVFGRTTILWWAVPASVLYGFLYAAIDRRATVELYESRGYPPGTAMLTSRQSLYNRIDVLQAPDGAKYLLLNGGQMFNPT